MGPVRALQTHQKSAPSSSALYIQGTEKGQGKRWDCRKSWKSPNRFASCLSDQKLLNSQAKLLWSISIPIEMQAETKWSQGENHFTLLDHFHGSRWRCSNFFFFFARKKSVSETERDPYLPSPTQRKKLVLWFSCLDGFGRSWSFHQKQASLQFSCQNRIREV